MTEEEIKQRNESKEFLKDLQYYLFQNKRSPKIDKLSVLLDDDEKQIADLEKENAELKETLRTYNGCGDWDNDFHTCRVYLQHEELQKCMEQLAKAMKHLKDLVYAVELGKNELATTRILAGAKEFLKEE